MAAFLVPVLLIAGGAAAEQVRIASGPAVVTEWRMAGETVATLPAGTSVEVLGRDDGYYWIVLPPDENGVRRSGWLNARLVATAADAPAPPPDVLSPVSKPSGPRWQLQAIGGTTLGVEASSLVAGAVGAALSPTLLLIGEMGRMGDIVPETMRSGIEESAQRAEQILSVVTGRPFEVSGEATMPATYGTAGLRYTIPRRAKSRPYVGAQIGFAKVSPTIRLLIGGDDVTRNFLPAQDVPTARTRLVMGFGSGLSIEIAPPLRLDLGYRYSRLFVEEGVNVNRLYGALGFGF
jgi:opacity protein-like surface antigen